MKELKEISTRLKIAKKILKILKKKIAAQMPHL